MFRLCLLISNFDAKGLILLPKHGCFLGYNFEETYVEEVEESSRLSADNERKLLVKDQSVLPGFRVASKSDYQLER